MERIANASQRSPARFELIDKDGNVVARANGIVALRAIAKSHWPDQSQDPDRTGSGWDVQVEGVE